MKKTKEQNENRRNDHQNDDSLSKEYTNHEVKTENSTGENSVFRNNDNPESLKAEDIQIDQPGQEEYVTSIPDYEALSTEWKDKYLRLSAEFDNYRKRTLKEKIELTRYANEELLKSLLNVIDDFELGLKTLEQAKDLDAVKDGIAYIYNKFKDFLSQKGLKEIDAMSNDFNTDFHEAVTKIPVEDKEKSGKIVDVLQKGYMLDDKVIRHAKVVIGE